MIQEFHVIHVIPSFWGVFVGVQTFLDVRVFRVFMCNGQVGAGGLRCDRGEWGGLRGG